MLLSATLTSNLISNSALPMTRWLVKVFEKDAHTHQQHKLLSWRNFKQSFGSKSILFKRHNRRTNLWGTWLQPRPFSFLLQPACHLRLSGYLRCKYMHPVLFWWQPWQPWVLICEIWIILSIKIYSIKCSTNISFFHKNDHKCFFSPFLNERNYRKLRVIE